MAIGGSVGLKSFPGQLPRENPRRTYGKSAGNAAEALEFNREEAIRAAVPDYTEEPLIV